ncbi:MAG TPA: hypothetical protein VNF47_07275 [Streptosporangiaceae bacterium]|nr:hypothetical protein [Streptosporangiaceae bacterium]
MRLARRTGAVRGTGNGLPDVCGAADPAWFAVVRAEPAVVRAEPVRVFLSVTFGAIPGTEQPGTAGVTPAAAGWHARH